MYFLGLREKRMEKNDYRQQTIYYLLSRVILGERRHSNALKDTTKGRFGHQVASHTPLK
jgi:hypothetical protein